MQVVKNGYTRVKLNGVYANNYPILVRTILAGFLLLLEKYNIATGEPTYNKEKGLYGFYTAYSSFFYDERKDDIVIYYNKTFSNDFEDIESENVIVKRYENLNDALINDLKTFIKTKKIIPSLETLVSNISKYNELGLDWNGYRCNPVSNESISKAIEVITYLYPKINQLEVSLHPYPIADGGNEVRRPADGSLSIVGIEMENGDRRFELEISKEGNVEPLIFEHSYDDVTYESNGLVWPKEYNDLNKDKIDPDEVYVITDLENDSFLKWAIDWMHYEI